MKVYVKCEGCKKEGGKDLLQGYEVLPPAIVPKEWWYHRALMRGKAKSGENAEGDVEFFLCQECHEEVMATVTGKRHEVDESVKRETVTVNNPNNVKPLNREDSSDPRNA